MFVLAHLSDPHLAPVPSPHPFELASKRLFGYLNWRHHRAAIHRAEIVDAIVRDLKEQSPTHIAVTGDLVNIALPGEFTRARAWLKELGPSTDVTLVPGNHDAYVRSVAEEPIHVWGDYMRGDEASPSLDASSAFPFIRRRGPVVLIGTSTAVPTSPLMATGWLGATQIARLTTILGELHQNDMFRILLIHHPPAGHRAAHKRLTDATALSEVLGRYGAALVLHGHDHVASLDWLAGPRSRIPVVGVPSASASAEGEHVPAAYNLYRIDRDADGAWACEVVSRGFKRGGDVVVELKREMLRSD
jgi:3',5'-cyclic AMP phosphodiesterase CpdA